MYGYLISRKYIKIGIVDLVYLSEIFEFSN